MPKFDHDGVSLHYEITGTGPPMLLLAGMCSDSASWAPLAPLLHERFTLIALDNRASGRTLPWDAPVSVPIYAQDAAALLAHLGLGRAEVVGHSLGGMIGLELAQSAPQHVARLTMLAAAPVRLARNVALFQALLEIREAGGAPDLWLRAFLPWLFVPALYDEPGVIEGAIAASAAYPHAQSTAAMRHQLGALDGYEPAARAPDAPVQALLGAEDMVLPQAIARKALAAVTGDIRVIKDAAHSVHWDAPGAVATALL